MKKTPKTMQAIVSDIASGAKPLDAALLNDVSARGFFDWLKKSREGTDPSMIVDWQGKRVPFASAVQSARLAAVRGDIAPSASGATVIEHHHFVHFVFGPASEPEAASAPEPVATPGEAAPNPRPAEPAYDAELAELLGPEPEPAAPVIPDEPEPVPDKPARPLAFDEPPAREPRSEMERYLFAQLAAARAKKALGTATGSGEPEGLSAGSASPGES